MNDELVRGNIRVSLVELGEGDNGDYNPDDPDDTEYLRFDVEYLDDEEGYNTESRCTIVSVAATPEMRQKFLCMIMNAVECKEGIKKICDDLSWTDDNDLRGE